MRIYLFGFGKMGRQVAACAQGHTLVSSLEEADVAIDFSVAKAVIDNLKMSCSAKIPLVIGTTGWEENLPLAKQLVETSGTSALYSPNFSIGIALFRKLLKEAKGLLPDYALAGVEYHHQGKVDAPSGTAKAIASDLDISPFSSVRCGQIVGKHEVLFDSPSDTFTFTHEAKNREGFALGAIKAAEWVWDKRGWFTLDDMLYGVDYPLR